MSTAIRTVHVRIEGRVQGVGYRAWVKMTALSLGLTGWVRNRRDGWVEAAFEGPAERVDDMLGRCHEGPPAARVARVDTLGEDTGGYRRFDVLPTA